MTSLGNNDGTQGWGVPFVNMMNLQVINDAIAGRSARSFTREGRFAAMQAATQPGDFVIIEFGHNDGGSPLPSSRDNGRADCPYVGNAINTTCAAFYG